MIHNKTLMKHIQRNKNNVDLRLEQQPDGIVYWKK